MEQETGIRPNGLVSTLFPEQSVVSTATLGSWPERYDHAGSTNPTFWSVATRTPSCDDAQVTWTMSIPSSLDRPSAEWRPWLACVAWHLSQPGRSDPVGNANPLPASKRSRKLSAPRKSRTNGLGDTVLFMTRYTIPPNADRSPENFKALLATFAELGEMDGEIAHYVTAEVSGGVIISENDSLVDAHERMLRYNTWLNFEITPMLSIEEAVGVAMKVYG